MAGEQSGQKSWLENILESTEKKFKMVAMHHPPVSFGGHYGDWKNPKFGLNIEIKRKRFINLLQRSGVQVVFAGHEHYFEHNIIRYEDDQNVSKKIDIFITGGGGVPLRNAPKPDRIEKYTEEGTKCLDQPRLKDNPLNNTKLLPFLYNKRDESRLF